MPFHPLEEHISRELQRMRVSSPLLLAVSGGADSMAMLHGIHGLHDQFSGVSVAVAHLNHGLRGDSGRADSDFVLSECQRLGVPVFVKHLTEDCLARQSRGSLEEAARKARYEFLAQTAVQNSIPFVVLGHHASDQSETILFNMMRGTGLRGMRGMPFQRPLNDSVSIIRPMLALEKSVIDDFIASRRIRFVTDETNSDMKMARNRIRHELLPKLKELIHPGALRSILELSQQADELLVAFDEIADRLLEAVLLESQPFVCRLTTERIGEFPVAVIRHAMTVLWARQNWPRRDMSRRHWIRLSEMLTSDAVSGMDFPAGIRVERRGDLVVISRNAR